MKKINTMNLKENNENVGRLGTGKGKGEMWEM